jgi:hypothetical protein
LNRSIPGSSFIAARNAAHLRNLSQNVFGEVNKASGSIADAFQRADAFEDMGIIIHSRFDKDCPSSAAIRTLASKECTISNMDHCCAIDELNTNRATELGIGNAAVEEAMRDDQIFVGVGEPIREGLVFDLNLCVAAAHGLWLTIRDDPIASL